MTTVTGYVRDQAGDLLADAAVRLYRRDTGALLGSAVSGDGVEIPGDIYYNDILLLLHCDGSNGGSVFTDSGPGVRNVSRLNNVTTTTSSPKFGSACLSFPGNGLIYPDISTDFNFSSDLFCVELWVKTTTGGAFYIADKGWADTPPAGSWCITVNPLSIYAADFSTSTALLTTADTAYKDGTWRHIAWTYDGSNHKLFVDGVVKDTETTSFVFGDLSSRVCFGSRYSNVNAGYDGFMDDIRITKGAARYTDTFTPTTETFADVAGYPAVPVGEYSISTSYSGEVQRIVCAPDAWDPIANDLLDRITLP